MGIWKKMESQLNQILRPTDQNNGASKPWHEGNPDQTQTPPMRPSRVGRSRNASSSNSSMWNEEVHWWWWYWRWVICRSLWSDDLIYISLWLSHQVFGWGNSASSSVGFPNFTYMFHDFRIEIFWFVQFLVVLSAPIIALIIWLQ